ncbi:MAG TPA: Spy/CpxP family protein refolding chaperone [Steroidobacteraceae bacterium]|jgi:Spy/CpxP family protein refolding chaperone|nr:Spy/CpxP family protein refolding chaperone [Steroidobacteraceae bacterium]
MKKRTKWLMVALAMTGVAGAVMGQTSGSSSSGGASSATPGAHHWKHHGMMAGGGLLHALHQLNLTPAQQQSVHTILTAARSQFAAERKAGGGPDFTALSNPGDPNYAAAKQDLQTRIANRIQEQTQTEQAIYKVLTSEQQAQLPVILANMKAKMAQHSTT